MLLRIVHGRSDPDDVLESWGFDGTTLRGVVGITVIYLHELRVCFVDSDAADSAQALTGWARVDELILETTFDRDLLHVPAAPTPEGTTGAWFGDWALDDDIDTLIDGLPQLLTPLALGERTEVLRRLGAALRDHAPEAADALEFPSRGS